MSTSKRRRRRQRARAPETPSKTEALLPPKSAALHALPEWRWRTFPVYFAFSIGLFLGVYGGAIGVWAGGEGNSTVFLVVSVIASIFMGFALSRLVVRFLASRNWVPAQRRRRP